MWSLQGCFQFILFVMQRLSWRDYIFYILSSSTDYSPSLRHISFTFYYYYVFFLKILCRTGLRYLIVFIFIITWANLKHHGNLRTSAECFGLMQRLSTDCDIVCCLNGAASPDNWPMCYCWACKYESVINERRLETSHRFKEENIVTSVFPTLCLESKTSLIFLH